MQPALRQHWPLGVILILFAVLTVGFASVTPYRAEGSLRFQRGADGGPATSKDIGAPDERQHANYVSRLLRGEGFPVLRPNDPELYENYQAHQPPLYYVLAAGWSTLTGSNPAAKGDGLKLRLLNLLIGLGGVAGAYFFLFWGLGRVGAAAAGASLCLMPMVPALHGALSNDPLLFALLSWTLALAARALRDDSTWKEGLVIGLVAGAALLTKTTALAGVATLAALALAVGFRRGWSRAAPFGVAILVAVVVASPWWIRNIGLYGDPFALSVFKESFGGTAQASDMIAGLGASTYWLNFVMWWTLRSFIGAFGYMDVFLFDSLRPDQAGQIYLALLFLIGIVFAAGVFGAAKKEPEEESSGFWIASSVMTLVVLALFVQFNRQYFQGQARYLYPALAALAALWGRGWEQLASRFGELYWMLPVSVLTLLSLLAVSQLPAAFALRLGP